jgi:ribosomal protein L7/L12
MKTEILKLKDDVKHGLDSNDAVTKLHQLDYTIVDSIKIVREEYGVSLGEAKTIVTSNNVWSVEVEAADKMHEEWITVLSADDDVVTGN